MLPYCRKDVSVLDNKDYIIGHIQLFSNKTILLINIITVCLVSEGCV